MFMLLLDRRGTKRQGSKQAVGRARAGDREGGRVVYLQWSLEDREKKGT
jgi:hypothetical protein